MSTEELALLSLFSQSETDGRSFNVIAGDTTGYVQDMYSVSRTAGEGGGRAWKVNIIGGGGGGGVTTIGALDGGTPSADGGSISGANFYFQSASDTVPGLMNTLDQTFSGNKSFSNNVILSGKTAGSILFLDGSKRIAEDNAMFFWDDTNNIFYVGANSGAFTNSKAHFEATVNNYSQINSVNKSNGTSASTDFIVTADTGTDSINFGDFGINSSTYSDAAFTISGALDTYLYGNGGNLVMGTATAAKTIKLHTGGTLAANLRMTIADTTMTLAGLGTTNTFTGQTSNTAFNGFSWVNSTAATSGNQQYSPFTLWQGQGFGSTGSVNRSVAMRGQMQPIQGTTNPSGNFVFDFSINGAAFANPINFNTLGYIGIGKTPTSPYDVLIGADGNVFNADRSTNNFHIFLNATIAEIGTTTANNLTFITSNATAMTLTTTRRLGINVAVPLSSIHLPAGTTSANSAPIQMNTGALETTARSGVVEYVSPFLYFTTTGTDRRLFQLGGVNTQSGTTYTGTTSDVNKYVDLTNTAARTFTLPAASTIPAGNPIWVKDAANTSATGNISVALTGGDTLDTTTGTRVAINQNSGVVGFYSDGTSAWFTT